MGRKKSLTLGVLVVTGGIMGESFSSTRAAFVVSKLILGVGVGFYLTLGPITCSEIAPTVLRGLSTAGVNLAIAVDQLISNSVTSGFGDRNDVWAFRGPFLAQLIFSVFLFIGSFLSPESPWYLVRAGKTEEARLVLQDLYGSEFEALEKLQVIQQTVEEEATMASPSYISAFKGTDRVRTLISVGVFACQHAVGIIFVLSFSTYFFQLAGLDTQKSLNLGVGVTACGVAGNICSWFIVNRFGRRPSFITGMFACTNHSSSHRYSQCSTNRCRQVGYVFFNCCLPFCVFPHNRCGGICSTGRGFFPIPEGANSRFATANSGHLWYHHVFRRSIYGQS